MIRVLVTSLALFPVWLVWSGMFDAFHLTLGVIACAVVAWLSRDLLITRTDFSRLPREMVRFFLYLPWLLYQVVLANVHVASLALHPRLPIDPQLVKFRSGLKTDLSKVVFANSITLTPGTITADIVDGEYTVHALSKKAADDLLTGDMEKRVARIFGED
ncbi:MAG: Na+/H+ antiporter subunit E [Nitrospirota bacterium]|nr:Na+/H+ antiporter subunit E [Nitrospirota bacterium]